MRNMQCAQHISAFIVSDENFLIWNFFLYAPVLFLRILPELFSLSGCFYFLFLFGLSRYLQPSSSVPPVFPFFIKKLQLFLYFSIFSRWYFCPFLVVLVIFSPAAVCRLCNDPILTILGQTSSQPSSSLSSRSGSSRSRSSSLGEGSSQFFWGKCRENLSKRTFRTKTWIKSAGEDKPASLDLINLLSIISTLIESSRQKLCSINSKWVALLRFSDSHHAKHDWDFHLNFRL